ncbi:ATP-dependent RNA helicase DDX60 [Nematocida sp. AWRm80]|nr:ATP-dependent RNA helicase DDX60 [Nematocida sp. AWRm80]
MTEAMKEEKIQKRSIETQLVEWYRRMPVHLVDISETFVGIGKILINGHSLYRLVEEIYSIKSRALPLKLVKSIAQEIAYDLVVAGFKDSYLVMFREEETEDGRDICAREMASILSMTQTLNIIWFESVDSQEYKQFLKEEHICIVAGYSDARSLYFVNSALKKSLYAAVMDKNTFRPPRILMYVISPNNYLPTERVLEETSTSMPESTKSTKKNLKDLKEMKALESTEEISQTKEKAKQILIEKADPETIAKMESRLEDKFSLHHYPNVLVDLPPETLKAIKETIETVKEIVLSDTIDGALLNGIEYREEEILPPEEEEVFQLPFIQSTMKSIEFYSKEQQRTIRSEQKYVESLKRSAQSLHEGKHLHNPITLVTDKSKRPKKETKEKISKKQLEIIEQNNKQKEIEAKKKDISFLKSFLAKYQLFSATYEKKRHLESFIPRIHSSFICLKVLLLRLEFYLEIWALERRKKKPNEKDLVAIYMDAVAFVEKYSKECTQKELEYVLQILFDLGFASTALELCYKHGISYTNKRDPEAQAPAGTLTISLSYDPACTKDPNDFDISFLMRAAGDRLKRTLNSRPDDRVLFEPDEWQIKLLDIVDRNESAVICAPTSSGKTFICYYAMERILRDSNDNVVIFVAPTKALVNQVAADVYARFGSKPYIKQNNILQGICMDDFQIKPFNCQILITIPSVLEKILTMPQEPTKKEKPYLERIKYIIIDEVHKISDSQMGSSMEKIIHFSPCALLLLSATIKNLEEFYQWTRSIERKKGRECHLVEHKERYCEIKNYVFVPKRIDRLESVHKSTREDGDVSLAAIHSLFAYSFRDIKEEDFCNDINFLPDELLNLYYAIFAILRKDKRHLIKEFRPQKFFKTNCITKGDIKQYERHVISNFRKLIQDNHLNSEQVSQIYSILVREAKEGFDKIEKALITQMDTQSQSTTEQEKNISVDAVAKGVSNLTISHNESTTHSTTETTTNTTDESTREQKEEREVSPDILLYNTEYLLDNILDLIIELKAKDMLPCIVFNLERTVCNALAIRLVEELDKFEKEAGPVSNKVDIRENEKALKELKRIRDAKPQTGGKMQWKEQSAMAEEKMERQIDPNARDPRFCFIDQTIASSGAYLLDEHAKALKKTGKLDSRLIHALYRGIGVHHTGTPKKYRNMVEILFRMKQLRVIFATETLSLGINMPCRTAVFAGDSMWLDSMSFKQMAGRAGRRGYDTQGNVVFFGIPKHKIQSLITSYLPNIKGGYTYTNVLAVQTSKITITPSVIDSFISYPLMSLSYPTRAFRIGNHNDQASFRRSLLEIQKKFLQQKLFLSTEQSTEKNPLGPISSLTDISLNLPNYDPSSFMFMAMVNKGILDDICSKIRDKEVAANKIMHLVASFFETIPLPDNTLLPTLDPLPEPIQNLLDHYRTEAQRYYQQFLTAEEKSILLLTKYTTTPIATPFFYHHIPTKLSSYALKYFQEPSVTAILHQTGIGETQLWRRLKGIEDILTQLSSYYRKYNNTAISAYYIHYTLDSFKDKFAKMQA